MQGGDRLGNYVKERRLDRGLTQADLADAVGVSHAAISDIERGKTKLPGAQVRRPLAAALGVSHLDLLVAAGELTREEAGLPAPPDHSPARRRLIALAESAPEAPEERLGVAASILATVLAAPWGGARDPQGAGVRTSRRNAKTTTAGSSGVVRSRHGPAGP